MNIYQIIEWSKESERKFQTQNVSINLSLFATLMSIFN